MAEVISIGDRRVAPDTDAPHPELVERLEQMLEEARAGKWRFMAYMVVGADEVIRQGHVGAISRHIAVAGVTYLKDMVVRYAVEDDD